MTLRLGDMELTPLLDGYLRLDGGAMFGTVPKPLWERRTAADERNRIRLAMRPLLVRGERLMIIDAGCGDKMDAKSTDIYGLDRSESLDVTLARAGMKRSDIELVLASHLHFDHAGGFTARDADRGLSCRRFPGRGIGSATANGRMRHIRTSGTGPAICPRISRRSRTRASWIF